MDDLRQRMRRRERMEAVRSYVWSVVAILSAFGLLLWLTGCSIVRTEFVDVDGTGQETFLMLAPWSKIDGSVLGLRYSWDGQGGGNIVSGQQAESIDQAAQAQGLEALGRGIVQGAVSGALGGGGVPVLPRVFGGGVGADVPTSTETVGP